MERYERQKMLTQIGSIGQDRLKSARVTVVGAGGLGSPVLTYLTMAGVGYIRVIDHDTVSLSNLNRQFLHIETGLGSKKAESARERLRHLNSELQIEAISEKLTEKNVFSLFENSDVVIDCVDHIGTRLIVNEACLEMGIPLVEGGISGFYGFVTAIDREHACLCCLGYDKKAKEPEVPALGATAGVIGSLQAMECLKIILKCGDILFGRMLQYDGLECCFDEIPVRKREDCEIHHQIDIEKGRK